MPRYLGWGVHVSTVCACMVGSKTDKKKQIELKGRNNNKNKREAEVIKYVPQITNLYKKRSPFIKGP